MIKIHLRADCREFGREAEVEKILKKHSQFINFPIQLNGELINKMQAIWYRQKREVTVDEYERFYEHLSQSKVPYKYMLHYSTDVPLAIKAVIYIPSMHQERMQMVQESLNMHLYSRKVMIKENCQELLPHYLRFVKGVVDCEDLPLNISRENYQDSGLVQKLRNVLTRRTLKLIEDEMKRDKVAYDKWYAEFHQFFKEGIMIDQENKEQLMRLMRYEANNIDGQISLDEYCETMVED